MSQVKHFSASASASEVFQHLKADGVVVIEGVATRQSIDAALAEIGQTSSGATFGLAAKSPTFAQELLMSPLFLDIADRVLTDTCIIYYEKERTVSTSTPQVSQTSIITAEPGSAPWGLRRQDQCHHITHPAKREADVGILYAATDMTTENGAIRVVVGSNHWTDDRDPLQEDETLVELRKGDAIIW
jgi:ectoine hydroxylase-related dioxygenase (phytanoyl-CoA dioxygenase family)